MSNKTHIIKYRFEVQLIETVGNDPRKYEIGMCNHIQLETLKQKKRKEEEISKKHNNILTKERKCLVSH